MKRLLCVLAAAGVAACAVQASAEELWDPHLRGVDEGLAAGALPSQGFYGVLDNYWAAYHDYDSGGKVVPNTALTAMIEVPILLWSTGVKILGADYGLAIAQPFAYTSAAAGYGVQPGAGMWGAYNTILIPAQLAWDFGDAHVKAGLSIYLDDASSTLSQVVVRKRSLGGSLPSGNGYDAVQPDLGFSWLHDGWNLSADLHVVFPVTADTASGYDYWSGDEFAADYTATKTIGKWTVGLGLEQEDQLNPDTQNGHAVVGSMATNLGVGPLAGYQFGGLHLLAGWNHNVYTASDVGGDFFNARFVVPFK